ncbi:MAG: HAD-IA family hydrolase [Verrucomicrobia bacterium]|nr:HAD-IA family hydrolase [Verrucomicrobiota bacterium]
MPRPDAIFFDAADTLMFLPRSVGEHYAEVAGRFGVTAEPTALDLAFRRAWQAMPLRAITAEGVARADDDRGWWEALVRLVAAEAMPELPDFDAYFGAVYDHFAAPGVWQAYPEAREVIATLQRAGLRLGIVSNFDRRLHANLRDLGLHAPFEHIVLSSETGADKPHARIFERACRLFEVAPERALHVGDDPVRDWQGAAAAGLQVFRLQRPENDLRTLLAELGLDR